MGQTVGGQEVGGQVLAEQEAEGHLYLPANTQDKKQDTKIQLRWHTVPVLLYRVSTHPRGVGDRIY